MWKLRNKLVKGDWNFSLVFFFLSLNLYNFEVIIVGLEVWVVILVFKEIVFFLSAGFVIFGVFLCSIKYFRWLKNGLEVIFFWVLICLIYGIRLKF